MLIIAAYVTAACIEAVLAVLIFDLDVEDGGDLFVSIVMGMLWPLTFPAGLIACAAMLARKAKDAQIRGKMERRLRLREEERKLEEAEALLRKEGVL